MEKQSFSLKLLSGDFYGQSYIKTVQAPRQVNTEAHIDVIRQNGFSHASVMVIGVSRDLKSYVKLLYCFCCRFTKVNRISSEFIICIMKCSRITLLYYMYICCYTKMKSSDSNMHH